MARNPVFTVYKKSGALQLEVIGADPDNVDGIGVAEKGFARLTMCKGSGEVDERGNPTYNWKENKIIFKCSDQDLADIYLALLKSEEKKIVHDPNAGTGEAKQAKFLNLKPGKTSGMFISLSFEGQDASLPLNDNEIIRLRILIPSAIQAIYGWYRFIDRR